MKHSIATLILSAGLFISPILLHAQEFEKVNLDSVHAIIIDSTSPNYYPKLLERFENFDRHLTNDEYRLLYYGFVYDSIYMGYNDHGKGDIYSAYRSEKFKKAIGLCEETLEKIPISLVANYMMALSLEAKDGESDESEAYMRRYEGLRDAILSSGDGYSCETAFKTIFVDDEYELLYNYFDLEFKSQSLTGDLCDEFDVKKNKMFDEKEIYFDTSSTMNALMKIFNK